MPIDPHQFNTNREREAIETKAVDLYLEDPSTAQQVISEQVLWAHEELRHCKCPGHRLHYYLMWLGGHELLTRVRERQKIEEAENDDGT